MNRIQNSAPRGICQSAGSALLTALLLTSLVPDTALASKPPQTPGSAVEQILPDETEPSVTRGNQRTSVLTGTPRALYRVGYRVMPGDPEAMARQYLKENAGLLRLSAADLGDVDHQATWNHPAGHTVRFIQHFAGVPIYKSQIAVTINRDSTVTFVTSGYQPNVRVPTTVPAITSDEARRLAADHLGLVGEPIHESRRLVIYHLRGVSRLAWEIKVVPGEHPIGDWEVLIDAHSGEIFKAVDNAYYVDGNGNIFEPDPLSSALATYGDPGFEDGNDADTPELTGELVDRALREITLNGGIYSLVGPYAEIRDFESPYKGTFSQASPTFDFTRYADGFEAVNTYYHIDNIMRYINIDLGVSIMPYQYSGGVQFDPHGLSGADNSHYLSSTGQVAFGEGGVDDAEDADVVIHELGHALHDWVTSGGLSQVEGLSEGVGDYLAQSYSRSLDQWTPADPAYHWVFNWDGHNPFWSGRTTDYAGHYPEDLVGQVHTDGQIWSTCMMKIWDAIGRDPSDKAMWVGLGMTGSSTNQEDAAQAVLQAAVDLSYTSGQIITMESIFRSCGYDVTAPCNPVCGNDTIECGELCDGTDLGGASCVDQGCTGGTLACNSTCDGFDTTACVGCPACNHNGVCDLGEDCTGCSDDCVAGTTPGAVCGNGLCEAGDGENCVNCAQDCNGIQTGGPSGRFCCGDGDGQNPLPCSDPACSTGGFSCTDVPTVPSDYCCGNLTCESGEGCSNCALDCTTGAELCDDGVDNDCDNDLDCDDADCLGDPACSCADPGEACTVDDDCCSGRCKRGTCR